MAPRSCWERFAVSGLSPTSIANASPAAKKRRRLPPDIQRTARRKLRQLDAVEKPAELRNPRGNRFEELKGDRNGTYSLRINDQWRITFTWSDGGADGVRIEDYHR